MVRIQMAGLRISLPHVLCVLTRRSHWDGMTARRHTLPVHAHVPLALEHCTIHRRIMPPHEHVLSPCVSASSHSASPRTSSIYPLSPHRWGLRVEVHALIIRARHPSSWMHVLATHAPLHARLSAAPHAMLYAMSAKRAMHSLRTGPSELTGRPSRIHMLLSSINGGRRHHGHMTGRLAIATHFRG